MFVLDTSTGKLKQILPAGMNLSSAGNWSSNGNDIVFSQHVTDDVHSSIWVVHSDGSGLHEVDVAPANSCGGLNSDESAQGCFSPVWSPTERRSCSARAWATRTLISSRSIPTARV